MNRLRSILNVKLPPSGGWSYFLCILGAAILVCDTDPYVGLHRRLTAGIIVMAIPLYFPFRLLVYFERRLPRVRLVYYLGFLAACLFIKLVFGTGDMVIHSL